MSKRDEEKIPVKLIIFAGSGLLIGSVLGILKLFLELPEKNILTPIGILIMYTPCIALLLYRNKIKYTKTKLSRLLLLIAIVLTIMTLIIFINYMTTYYL